MSNKIKILNENQRNKAVQLLSFRSRYQSYDPERSKGQSDIIGPFKTTVRISCDSNDVITQHRGIRPENEVNQDNISPGFINSHKKIGLYRDPVLEISKETKCLRRQEGQNEVVLNKEAVDTGKEKSEKINEKSTEDRKQCRHTEDMKEYTEGNQRSHVNKQEIVNTNRESESERETPVPTEGNQDNVIKAELLKASKPVERVNEVQLVKPVRQQWEETNETSSKEKIQNCEKELNLEETATTNCNTDNNQEETKGTIYNKEEGGRRPVSWYVEMFNKGSDDQKLEGSGNLAKTKKLLVEEVKNDDTLNKNVNRGPESVKLDRTTTKPNALTQVIREIKNLEPHEANCVQITKMDKILYDKIRRQDIKQVIDTEKKKVKAGEQEEVNKVGIRDEGKINQEEKDGELETEDVNTAKRGERREEEKAENVTNEATSNKKAIAEAATAGAATTQTSAAAATTPTTAAAATTPTKAGAAATPTTTGAATTPTTAGAAAIPTTTGASATPTTVGAATTPTKAGAATPTTAGVATTPTTAAAATATTVPEWNLPQMPAGISILLEHVLGIFTITGRCCRSNLMLDLLNLIFVMFTRFCSYFSLHFTCSSYS